MQISRSLAVLALALGVVTATPADADVVFDDVIAVGSHPTREDAVVRVGPWRGYTSWTYEVRAGDTVSEIAQHELGTMRRTQAVLALNPGVEPRSLMPGQRLRMPPQERPLPVGATEKQRATFSRHAQVWWDFYTLPASGARPRLVAEGAKVHWHPDGVILFAARHDEELKVLSALAAAPGRAVETLERLARDGIAAVSRETLGGRGVADDESPVHYVVTEYEVQAIRAGRIVLKVTARRELDQNRLPIGASSSGTSGFEMLLLTLAFGALLVVVVLLRRRSLGFEVPVHSS